MKNKNGFVFVETLIVVAVLTISLIGVYSSYNAVIMKENNRIRNNDSVYLYRTYYLEKFFRNFRLDTVASGLSKTGRISTIANFGCATSNIFINEEDNIGFCEELVDDFHISNLYLTYNDLSFLQNCTNARGLCEALSQVNETGADYLQTIGGAGKIGYRIIVEFAENKDGSKCTNDTCRYYYTTLSLGEL